jgi:PKD repeat protein
MRSLSFFAKSRTISLLVGLIILAMILPGVVSAQSISSSVVNTPPKAQFTSNTIQGQSPLTVQFFDQSTGTAPMTYHWDFSDGAGNLPENSQQNPSWKFWDNDATSFTVSLTVTNAYGTDTIVKQNFITLVDTSVDTSSLSPNPATDKVSSYGRKGDTRVFGDWNGDGKTKIGVYKDGAWYLDYNGNGAFDSNDKVYAFGKAGWIPVTGDWNGDKKIETGVYLNGNWYLDYNGNGAFDSNDKVYAFGKAGWTQIVGDWNGDGKTEIGIYKEAVWYLD